MQKRSRGDADMAILLAIVMALVIAYVYFKLKALAASWGINLDTLETMGELAIAWVVIAALLVWLRQWSIFRVFPLLAPAALTVAAPLLIYRADNPVNEAGFDLSQFGGNQLPWYAHAWVMLAGVLILSVAAYVAGKWLEEL